MIFNATPVLDICDLIEEWGYFVTMRQKRPPHLLVEWSSNDWHVFKQHHAEARYYIHPDVPLTYLGLHSETRTVAEFQLGAWGVRPTQEHEFDLIADILTRLRGFRPNNVATPNYNKEFFLQQLEIVPRGLWDDNGGGTSTDDTHERTRRYLSGQKSPMRGRNRGMRHRMGRGGHRPLSVLMPRSDDF